MSFFKGIIWFNLFMLCVSDKRYYVKLFSGGTTDLYNGGPSKITCHKWEAKNSSSIRYCKDPELRACYLELPQTKPFKTTQMRNLVLEMNVQPDSKCGGRCDLQVSLLIYWMFQPPEEYRISVMNTLRNNKIRKFYGLKNSKKINAIYFRITAVDFCGTINDVQLYTVACDEKTTDAVVYPEYIPESENEIVNGTCATNGVYKSEENLPTSVCDTLLDSYTDTFGQGCFCKKGFAPVNNSCKACRFDEYKENDGDDPCKKCGHNAVAVRNRTSCKCIEGYVHEPGNKVDCFERSKYGVCPRENVTNSRTSYTFPESMVSTTVMLSCYGYNSIVIRQCRISKTTKQAKWDEPNWSNCGEKEMFTIKELKNVPVDADNAVVVARTLSNVTLNATEIDSAEGLEDVTTVMENCLKVSSSNDKEVGENVLNSINNIMRVNKTVTSSSKTLNKRVLGIIDEVAKKALDEPISFSGHSFGFGAINTTENEDFNAIVTKQKDTNQETCISKLAVGFTKTYTEWEIESIMLNEDKGIESTNVAEISIPKSVFREKKLTEADIYVYTFKNDNLFPVEYVEETTSNRIDNSVASYIIATSVYNKTLQGLDHEITIKLKVMSMEEARRGKCSFWKFPNGKGQNVSKELSGYWSTEGCRKFGIITTEIFGNIYIICKCTHLTNFAVLFNVHGEKLEKIKSQNVLNIVTFIGCTISMVSLIATLVSYLGISDIRRRTARKILINFCFSLLLLLVTFMFGINQTARPPICHAVATFLHLFTLSTFAWMSVQAVFLYKKSVRATKNRGESKKTYRISFIISWGIPIAIACATCYFTIPQFNGMNRNHFCVITGMTFNITTLAPVVFLILVNVVLFIPVIAKIQSHMTNRSRLSKSETSLWRRLKVTISCSTLLGLTWIFGFLAVGDLRIPFQWLFCLANSLQGFFIFVFHVVLNEKLRNEWRKIILPSSRASTTSDTSRTNHHKTRNGTVSSYHRPSTKCPNQQSLSLSSSNSDK